jgi:hypothetical protein
MVSGTAEFFGMAAHSPLDILRNELCQMNALPWSIKSTRFHCITALIRPDFSSRPCETGSEFHRHPVSRL